MPSMLLTPEETLKTRDRNQKKFTSPRKAGSVFISAYVNCSVVAVTLEKNVAIVVMLTYRIVSLSFSSARKVGNADLT